MQITGREAYTKFNAFYQQHYDKTINLVDKPELVATNHKIGVISGLWYFKDRVIPVIKRSGKSLINAVSKSVNGGNNGKTTRETLYNKAKTNVKCH